MVDRPSLETGRCVEPIVCLSGKHWSMRLLTSSANMDDFVSRWKTLNFPKSEILDYV